MHLGSAVRDTGWVVSSPVFYAYLMLNLLLAGGQQEVESVLFALRN
jgi:hypothetical protein